MQVEMRPIHAIRPYENNPRLNDDAVEAVAASIREYGFRQPIIVDEAGVIIVGHTRYKAALRIGVEEVPVHIAAGLTPAQAKAYRLAANQTATLSQWDDDKLPLDRLVLVPCRCPPALSRLRPGTRCPERHAHHAKAAGQGQTTQERLCQ